MNYWRRVVRKSSIERVRNNTSSDITQIDNTPYSHLGIIEKGRISRRVTDKGQMEDDVEETPGRTRLSVYNMSRMETRDQGGINGYFHSLEIRCIFLVYNVNLVSV